MFSSTELKPQKYKSLHTIRNLLTFACKQETLIFIWNVWTCILHDSMLYTYCKSLYCRYQRLCVTFTWCIRPLMFTIYLLWIVISFILYCWFCRQVIEGTQTLKKMEEQDTMNERPTKDIKITDCGVLQFQF